MRFLLIWMVIFFAGILGYLVISHSKKRMK